MNRFLILLYISCCSFVFSSCEEGDEVSPVAIFIEPNASSLVTVRANEKCFFHIDFYTGSDYVKRLKVTSKDKVRGQVDVDDYTWTEYHEDMDYVYTAPVLNKDTTLVTLKFTAWDNADNKCETERYVKVVSAAVLMAERTGISLWASESGRANALCFADPTKTFNLNNAEEGTNADLILDTDASFSNIKLASNTTTKFVRNNSYDYAAATSVSLQETYAAARRTDIVENLQVNDIILVGHGDMADGVFQVTDILRNADGADNYVRLAYKGIERKVSSTENEEEKTDDSETENK